MSNFMWGSGPVDAMPAASFHPDACTMCAPDRSERTVFNFNPIEFIKGGRAEEHFNRLKQTKYIDQGSSISCYDMDVLMNLHRDDKRREEEIKQVQKKEDTKRIISYFYTQKR